VYRGNRQKQASDGYFYSEDQVRRSLLAAGIDVVYEVESDFIIFCPYHNNYRSPAAEVSKENGLFYCFGCQESHSLIEVIMHVTKRSYFESARMVDSKSENVNFIESMEAKLNKKPDFVEFDNELIKRLNTSALNSQRAANYYLGRGITKDSVERYLLGYSESQDMVTIPVHSPDGMCLGFVGRSVEGKEFKNTPGLPKAKTMFNLFRAKRFDKVFVVESSFDAIRLEQAGAHAVATLGASVSSKQRELLKKYFNNVIVLGDNDDAGKEMANKLTNILGSNSIRASLPESVKDVSDLSDEELKKFVSQFDDLVSNVLQ
jgi:DNA primase